jgi:glycosidase
MLAEAEVRDLHAEAFDATYAWSLYEAMVQVAKGKSDVGALIGYYSQNEGMYPRDIFRLTAVSNHDKNSWDGTGPEQFGPALDAAIVLTVVGDGIPMIYNGQEAGETKRLKFFEKDPIEWHDHPHTALYTKLFGLKHANTALWNAHWGALMVHVPSDDGILSFVRANDRDKVFAVFNLTKESKTAKFKDGPFAGTYTDFFTGEKVTLGEASALQLAPWGYRVFVR